MFGELSVQIPVKPLHDYRIPRPIPNSNNLKAPCSVLGIPKCVKDT